MSRKRRLASPLRRWHRRLGLVSALFVLILASTGFLLLFADKLGLDQHHWGGPAIAGIYQLSPEAEPIGVPLGNDNWVIMVDGLVYVGASDPTVLSPPLLAAMRDDEFIYFSNGEETVLSLPDGTLIERRDGMTFSGSSPAPIPAAIRKLAIQRFSGRGLPISRVLLDIHTGRFFGPLGSWLMALASLLLILLSLSGVYMWGKNARR
ncbi:MAG: hypothetical protein COA47_12330 [Robiginitomaculum sp.]|nr:MAG: hypothetical protein COA47_12330 [Robiginitomaculum sp.]